ncbi:MAG: tetratricopeptide repeat protein [Verrucomicrobia bacterium]|nr:tetratricopeptide repeat protein [Verrucomicrobiota bacterium]
MSAPTLLDRAPWLAPLSLLGATAIAYANTLHAPFVFDDGSSLLTNPSLRPLWPPWSPFFPPPHLTVSGRPVVNATFALNHALSGTDPWSYHALNVAIHALAGLVLFGLVRRTLDHAGRSTLSGHRTRGIAWLAAAGWALHPLQTESVTYTVQRVESLMSLFFLLTLYAFARAAAPGAPRRWLVLSVIACLLGMGSKEVMVSAPLLVLLYDRTLIAGTFRAAWQQRTGYYLALAATWLLLGGLVFGTQDRGGTAGFGAGMSALSYGLTQLRALGLYLKLAAWPDPLVFDYGTALSATPAEIGLPGMMVAALIGVTIWAVRRRHAAGFLGVAFLAILAPSSSVIPVATQTVAEHRIYLALGAVIVGIVLGINALVGRRTTIPALAVLMLLATLTLARNATYRSGLALWADTAAKCPANPRAHYNLGAAQAEAGSKTAAIASYETALRLDPDSAAAHNTLAVLLDTTDRRGEALHHYEAAARLDPANAEARNNLGHTLATAGRIPEALPHLEAAIRLRPDYPEAHNTLGEVLARSGRSADALPHFAAALKTRPGYSRAHGNLGGALLELNRTEEAMTHLEEAIRLNPDYAEAHGHLALVLLNAGRLEAAARHYAAVLRLAPSDATAQSNLGYIALQQGRTDEAIRRYETVAQARPDEAAAHYNLGIACLRGLRWADAAAAFERTLQLDPTNEPARQRLMRARAQLPR